MKYKEINKFKINTVLFYQKQMSNVGSYQMIAYIIRTTELHNSSVYKLLSIFIIHLKCHLIMICNKNAISCIVNFVKYKHISDQLMTISMNDIWNEHFVTTIVLIC